MFPLLSFTHCKEVLGRDLVLSQFPDLLLRWVRAGLPSGQGNSISSCGMHSPPSSPLSLFVCFSSISTSDPSLLFYPQVGNTHPHRPEFLFVLLACICSCLGGKSDQPRLDQLAAFKLGIKELGAPSLCSHSSFYLRALSLGEAMGTVFYIIKASFLIWLVMLEYSICWTEHTRASGSVAP